VIALAAVLGLALGHGFDLLFDRLYTDRPLGGPLYRCGACRATPAPAFLLPFIGYLRHRGRCPNCGASLPLRALLLPAGAAVLFALSNTEIDGFGAALLAGTFATIFLALTFTDLERRLIPNRVVYPSLLLAAAFSWVWPDNSVAELFAGGLFAVAIAAVLVLLSLPFGADAFGWGDAKMIVLMGLVLGMPSAVVALFVGTVAAGAVAAVLMLARLRGRRDYIPHGPFLALGAVIGLWWGQELWSWYVDR